MIPGISANPSARTTSRAPPPMSLPMPWIRPPSTATSLTEAGLPVPSNTSAFLNRMSRIERREAPSVLKDVLREVVVAGDAGEALVDVLGVDGDGMALALGSIEGDFVEQSL